MARQARKPLRGSTHSLTVNISKACAGIRGVLLHFHGCLRRARNADRVIMSSLSECWVRAARSTWAKWILVFLRAAKQCPYPREVSPRAQSNLSFNILEDTHPVAGFNPATFIADVIDQRVQARREFIVVTTQTAIDNRVARQCCR